MPEAWREDFIDEVIPTDEIAAFVFRFALLLLFKLLADTIVVVVAIEFGLVFLSVDDKFIAISDKRLANFSRFSVGCTGAKPRSYAIDPADRLYARFVEIDAETPSIVCIYEDSLLA